MQDTIYRHFIKEAVDLVAPQEFKEGRAWGILGSKIDQPSVYKEGLTFTSKTKTAKAGWFKAFLGGESRATAKTLEKAKAHHKTVSAGHKKELKELYAPIKKVKEEGGLRATIRDWAARGFKDWGKPIAKGRKARISRKAEKIVGGKKFKDIMKRRREASDALKGTAAEHRVAEQATGMARAQAAVGSGGLIAGGAGVHLLKKRNRKKKALQAEYGAA